MIVDFVAEGRSMSKSVLITYVLGNYFPKESEGYRPCLEIEFEGHFDAWEWYARRFKVRFDDKELKDSEKEGFKKISSKYCTFTRITDEQMTIEIENYMKTYSDNNRRSA